MKDGGREESGVIFPTSWESQTAFTLTHSTHPFSQHPGELSVAMGNRFLLSSP